MHSEPLNREQKKSPMTLNLICVYLRSTNVQQMTMAMIFGHENSLCERIALPISDLFTRSTMQTIHANINSDNVVHQPNRIGTTHGNSDVNWANTKHENVISKLMTTIGPTKNCLPHWWSNDGFRWLSVLPKWIRSIVCVRIWLINKYYRTLRRKVWSMDMFVNDSFSRTFSTQERKCLQSACTIGIVLEFLNKILPISWMERNQSKKLRILNMHTMKNCRCWTLICFNIITCSILFRFRVRECMCVCVSGWSTVKAI